ncbi:hypothetical protein [Paenibacillus baimaensis]|nr:hypothetical protein [Paenibacillus sp. WQ 127069]
MSKLNEIEKKVTKFDNSLVIIMTDALQQLGLEAGATVRIAVHQSDGERP